MYNVLDVAIYVINYAYDAGCGESMSNLKLQKILYYIQAAFLVEKNRECFKAVIDKRLIEKVVDTYAEITEPIVLAKKTCEEDPWKNTSLNKEIKNSLIRKYYLVVKKNGRN